MTRSNQYAIKGSYMQARFKRVCKAMGWDCDSECWTGEGAARVSTIGHTWMQKAPYPGIWRVVQIGGPGGGERVLSSNFTPREMAAWFEGILAAHETLAKLHSDVCRSVDSGRGNEIFIACAIERSL